jgi:ribosomal protein L37E
MLSMRSLLKFRRIHTEQKVRIYLLYGITCQCNWPCWCWQRTVELFIAVCITIQYANICGRKVKLYEQANMRRNVAPFADRRPHFKWIRCCTDRASRQLSSIRWVSLHCRQFILMAFFVLAIKWHSEIRMTASVVRRPGFDSWHYQKRKSSGSGTGSTQPREYNWGAIW